MALFEKCGNYVGEEEPVYASDNEQLYRIYSASGLQLSDECKSDTLPVQLCPQLSVWLLKLRLYIVFIDPERAAAAARRWKKNPSVYKERT